MSKAGKPAKNSPQKSKAASEEIIARPNFFSLASLRWKFVVLLAVIFYANTYQNQFALDDGLVFRDNVFVQQGANGIDGILTHDSYYGAMGNNENLSGGRYRPLPMVIYALIVSADGMNTTIPHVLNILLYALTAVLLLFFLDRFVFINKPNLSLAATILFIIHPVHTEVVANIKSLDEILSLLFLLLTLNGILSFCKNPGLHRKKYFYAVLFYFLALFSKENGITFVVLIPITIYFFTSKKWKEILRLSIPFWLIAIFYIAFRIAVLGWQNNSVQEIMDNPYVNAGFDEKYATILFVLLQYIRLMFFPYPLTYDYSYNQVPYRIFSDPWVIISFLIYLSVFIYTLLKWNKKDLVSWCIVFFLANLFIVSNIIINVGAPMAERFLYLPSIAFAILMVELCRRLFTSLHFTVNVQRSISVSALIILTVICFSETFARNRNWFNDSSLMLHDVSISKNSARANTYAGISLIRDADSASDDAAKNSYFNQAIWYFSRSLQIDSSYNITYLNLGVAFSRMDSLDEAENAWNKARALAPGSALLAPYDQYLASVYFNKGLDAGKNNQLDEAVADLEKSVHYNENDANAWYNLGGAYFTTQQFAKAKAAFEKSLELDPNQQQAQQALKTLQQMGY